MDLRADFPILQQMIHGKRLVYLDNAASTQKPQCVIQAQQTFYETCNANVHRGVHQLSAIATEAYEESRRIAARFIHARDSQECVFVKNTTEAINLVAYSFGSRFVKAGDEIVISALEHHSNIVPWQMLCQRTGATLKVIPMNSRGELILDNLDAFFTPKTRLVAITHVSNALGTIVPIEHIIEHAHSYDIPVLIDGAQSIAHLPIDVQALDCDFFVFSGHKVYGPTGIGVLYGKAEWLAELPPFLSGGDMITKVSLASSSYQDAPYKFEAGTPPIAEAIGLGAALTYLQARGRDRLYQHEAALKRYLEASLAEMKELVFLSRATNRIGIQTFNLPGLHAHDLGTLLDEQGVAIRAGHHCAMPIMDFFGVPASARVSLGIYNTEEDIDCLVAALRQAQATFKLG